MSMPATDYNQQLLCYLQNWRQLLDQWAAMAAGPPFLGAPPVVPTAPAGGQFMPPFMPFMPFMPPMPPRPVGPTGAAVPPAPPAPADYTQQLFSYLQAWRQYLEQVTGAGPAWPQAWTAPSSTGVPADDGGKSGPNRPPNGPNPPDTGNSSFFQSDDSKSDPIPPKVIPRPPFRSDQTQLTEIRFDPAATPFDRPGERFDRPGEQFQMADPALLAARPITSHPMSEATAHPEAGTAFLSTMSNVEPTALPRVEPQSLFSTPGASTSFQGHGESPSP
jgi:hypothetical protein